MLVEVRSPNLIKTNSALIALRGFNPNTSPGPFIGSVWLCRDISYPPARHFNRRVFNDTELG